MICILCFTLLLLPAKQMARVASLILLACKHLPRFCFVLRKGGVLFMVCGNPGKAEWMDKGHRRCLILWRRIQDWAELLLSFVSVAHCSVLFCKQKEGDGLQISGSFPPHCM